MPDLIIDSIKVSVPAGTTVLEAAERVGVMIPRFCWHPALGSAGSCRMCAVMFTDGPVKGLQMSCMVKARDGMVVDTGHPEALAFRKHIAELLMLHHPHDCPVCDEGGHCLLQDTTISCGHSLRSFKGKKRTYRNQDLGPLVVQEMNRCIHCYRCARYYQEVAGGRDFGPVRIAGGVQYGRFAEGPLESPFAGNLTEICPTGVFTDKPSRHKARHWDLERAPGVCLSCSLGCNTTVNARYREVIRIESRENGAVNGHFICDRGRHGYEYANLPDRPRQAQVDGRDVPMQAALDEATSRLAAIVKAHGPSAVACLGSSRQSLESQAMLAALAAAGGWRIPEYSTGGHRKKSCLTAVTALDKSLHVSQQDVAASDCVLVVGLGPLSEAPMLALALRQAARRGAAVAVIDPRPVSLPAPFTHIPARRRDMEAALGAVLHAAVPSEARPGLSPEALAFLEALDADMPREAGGEDSAPQGYTSPGTGADGSTAGEPSPPGRHGAPSVATNESTPGGAAQHAAAPGQTHGAGQALTPWRAFAARLAASTNPVIVCGTDIVPASTPALAAGAARLLAQARGRAGFFPVLAGANAYGAALMNADPATSFDDVLAGIESGAVKALVCVESDPAGRYAAHDRIQKALYKLDLLLTLDYLPTATRWQSHVFLPTQTVFEAGGSFVNQEGRLQHARPAMACGTPLALTLSGGDPPRTYSTSVPGGDPLPAWDILARLGEMAGCDTACTRHPWRAAARLVPALAALDEKLWPFDGLLLTPETAVWNALSARPDQSGPDTGADLIITEQAFGTEELSSYGSILKSLAPSPQVVLHAKDADTIRLRDEDFVHLACPLGQVQCYVRLVENMARGAVVLPRRADSGWRHAVAMGDAVELSLFTKQPDEGGRP